MHDQAMALKNLLDQAEHLRQYLFIRGFLVTDGAAVEDSQYPFYGNWKCAHKEGYTFYTHPLTGIFFASIPSGGFLYLLGHAYNPFTMEHREEQVLENLAEHFGKEDFFDCLSQLTGIFVLGHVQDGKISVIADPAGIQSACHGYVDGTYYLTSHPQLVADICDLEMDPFVKRLANYKWYSRVMGAYLPADLTPFIQLKRIVPNMEYTAQQGTVKHTRFYPVKELKECATAEEYQNVIEQAADILKNNMVLIARKWKNPWISLTGGIDSNTTFAAANGAYDRYQTFSYCAAEKETIDCEAAQKIAAAFDVPWTVFQIPEAADALTECAEKFAIIRHNSAHIALAKDHDMRKWVYLAEHLPADVEVKSWVSETIRGYWYKYYGRKTMPKLSAKLYRNLYKIFLWDRKLAHEVDKLFEKYIAEFEYRAIPSQYPPADIHFNEVTWGSWGSMNISDMKFYGDITIAYNNRKFLDLLFRVPLEKRISDEHHLDMKKYLNRQLYDMGIRVVNMHETKFRAFCLNCIFTVNSILPF